MNRRRILAAGFLGGACLLLVVPDLPWLWAALALACLLALLLNRWPRARLGMIGVSIGVLLVASQAAIQLDRRLPAQSDRLDIRVQGRVIGIPVVDRGSLRFRLRVEQWLPLNRAEADAARRIAPATADAPALMRATQQPPELASEPPDWPMRTLQLGWYRGAPPLVSGERWELSVRLRTPRGLGNPGSFDKAAWLFRERVHATGYVRQPGSAQRLAPAAGLSLAAWRMQLADALARAAPHMEHLGLVQALTLGLGHGVPDDTRQVLIDSGTAHLLAISGLHVGLLAGLAHRLGAFIWWLGVPVYARLRPPARRAVRSASSGIAREALCLALAVPTATFYALLSGFALPTQRALIMLLVLAAARLCGRRVPAVDGWLLAMVAVVLFDPLSLLSPGLWLSFGAVALILWLGVGYQRAPGARASMLRGLRLHTQLGLALLPLSLWFFDAGPLVAPLANLLAIPVMGFLIVPGSLLGLALAQLAPELAGVWLGWLGPVFTGLLAVLQSLSIAVPALSLALPGRVSLFLLLLAVVVTLAPTGRRALWLVPVLALPVLVQATQGVRTAALEVHVLDVGQGLATLVLTPNSTLLFDTGGRLSPKLTMTEAVVLPYLQALGRQLDRLVVSHADDDHSAGVARLREQWPDLPILASVPDSIDASGVERCEAGQSWSQDGVSFSVLHPAAGDIGSENDRSCVLLVHLGRSRILLTGDIEATAEARLAQRSGPPLPVSVVLAPHHGSRSSSTPVFLEQFPANHVVYPAGFGNRFGFPHHEVQMRYKMAGAKEHSTAEGGALRFRFDRDGILSRPSAYWPTQQRIWHSFRE